MASRSFKLVSDRLDISTSTSSQSEPCDWNKCIVCQSDTDEQLQCPKSTKRANIGAGYVTIADNLLKFKDLNCLPTSINLDSLDDGSGLQSTLMKNNARWHKSCYLKFNSTELKRAQKRISQDDQIEDTGSAKKATRTSLPCSIGMKEQVCFFCGKNETGENIHQASTHNIDARRRVCSKTTRFSIIGEAQYGRSCCTGGKLPCQVLSDPV